MNETEKLKENTEKQYVQQRLTEISHYLKKLLEDSFRLGQRALQADRFMTWTMLSYFFIVFLGSILDIGEVVRRVTTDWAFLCFLLSMSQAWYCSREFLINDGEWNGAIKILTILGMVSDVPDRPVRNKKSFFERGIELVKEWTQKKEESQKKVYART